MIDSIKNFMSDVKERTSSPFFSSFIISWLIVNWQVPIGLIFYKNNELAVDRYLSPIDLIKQNSSTLQFLIFPLIGAALFTFGYPYFKRLVILFNIKIDKERSEKAKEYSKGGYIPVSKYLQLSEKSRALSKELFETIKNEETYKNEVESLKVDFATAQSTITNMQVHNERFVKWSNPSMLNGEWLIIEDVNDTKQKTLVVIENGVIKEKNGKIVAHILDFCSNLNSNSVYFATQERAKKFFFRFDGYDLVGTELKTGNEITFQNARYS